MTEQQSMSIKLIEHYYEIKRYEQVVKLIKNAMDEHIENYRIWYMLGFSNYQLGSYEEAEEQLIEAMRLGMNREPVLYILGHVYMELEQYKKAEEAFLEGLRLNPNHPELHASYAYLMKKTGHRNKAKMLIQKALELDPGNAHVLRLYLRLEGMTSEKSKQMQALEQYMNSGDSELTKLIQLGILAGFQNKEKEAREYFRQAFLLKPDDPYLISMMEQKEFQTHFLLAPLRLVDRIGGLIVLMIIVIAIFIVLQMIGQNDLAIMVAFVYVLFVIYSWVTQLLLAIIWKLRR